MKKKNKELGDIVNERTKEISKKNELLLRQTDELNQTNTSLEERQQQIEEQTEELMAQKEEIQSAYNRVNELNLMKDKFFSIIGHDLKNPINIIMGFSELLVNRKDKIAEGKKIVYAESIYTSAKNTITLLENLLDWALSKWKL